MQMKSALKSLHCLPYISATKLGYYWLILCKLAAIYSLIKMVALFYILEYDALFQILVALYFLYWGFGFMFCVDKGWFVLIKAIVN